MKSPCIGVCSTGLGDDVCRGCERTLGEIREWGGMSIWRNGWPMRRA